MLNLKAISKTVTLSLALTFSISSYSQEAAFYDQAEELQVVEEKDTSINIQEASLEEKVDYLIAKDLAGVLNGGSTEIITAAQCSARGGSLHNCSGYDPKVVLCPTGTWCLGANGAFIDDVKN